MKKKILSVFGSSVILVIIAIFAITNGLTDGKNVVLEGIDLSCVSDGSYTGTYAHGRWTNTLTVQIKNNKIVGIDINKDVFAPEMTNCSEEVFRRVLEAQNTQIDTASGATVTSKAYLNAIENALEKR